MQKDPTFHFRLIQTGPSVSTSAARPEGPGGGGGKWRFFPPAAAGEIPESPKGEGADSRRAPGPVVEPTADDPITTHPVKNLVNRFTIDSTSALSKVFPAGREYLVAGRESPIGPPAGGKVPAPKRSAGGRRGQNQQTRPDSPPPA